MTTEREQRLVVKAVTQEEELRMLRQQVLELKSQIAAHPPSGSNGTPRRPSSAHHQRQRSPDRQQQHHEQQQQSSAVVGETAGPLLPSFAWGALQQQPAASHGVGPPPSEGHSAVPYEGRMVTFGGRSATSIFSETWMLHIASSRWSRVAATGNAPWGRYGHSAVVYKTHMFVHGGFGPGAPGTNTAPSTSSVAPTACGLVGTVHALDLSTKHWTELSNCRAEPCKGHSAVVHRGTMYVFGGCVAQGRTNAVRALALDEERWCGADSLNAQLVALRASGSGSGGASHLLARSDIPVARSGHCAGVHFRSNGAPDSMVVFGGRLSKYGFTNDVFEYNLESKRWVRMYCGGAVPSPRSDHSGTVYRAQLIVFGGYCVEQIASDPSRGGEAEEGASPPKPAASTRKTFLNDVHVLNLVSCTWSRVDASPDVPRPLGLCGHSSVSYTDAASGTVCLAVHGGFGLLSTATRGQLHADEESRNVILGEGAPITDYGTTRESWSLTVARAPPSAIRPRPPSAAGLTRLSRPSTAGHSRSRGGSVSPRAAAASGRESSRKGGPQGGGGGGGRSGTPRSFSIQTSKAATAKLFGDPPYQPPLPAAVRRSAEEIDQINRRLAVDDVKRIQTHREKLRSRFLKEAEPHPLSSEEQQESVDRLYYQQTEWRQEKAKQLQQKWMPTRPVVKAEWDSVQDTVARLTAPPERKPSPPPERHFIGGENLKSAVDRLYYGGVAAERERREQLQNKHWATVGPKKLPADRMGSLIERLATASPGSTTAPRAATSPRR